MKILSTFLFCIKSLFIFLVLLVSDGYSQAPVVSFTSSAIMCSAQTVTFTDQSSNSPTSWAWSFPGGSPSTSSLQNPTVTYPAAGTYTITHGASVTNFTGTPVTQTIYVAPSPTVAITYSPQIACPWETATLTASGAGSYLWNPGALTGSSVIVPPVTTIYTLVATSGSCSITTPTLIVFSPVPSFTTAPFPVNVCITSTSVAIVAFQMSGGIYNWSTGGNNTATLVVSPPVNQTYVCFVKGNMGCNAEIFQVSVLPTPTIIVNPAVICAGTATLMCSTGAVAYTWTPPTGLSFVNSACPLASPTVNTTYTVTGIANLLAGCQSSTIVTINVNPQPTITVTQATLCVGESKSICATGAITYSWITTTGLDSYSVSCPVAGPTITTNYYVAGTGANGCKNTFSTQVVVNKCLGINDEYLETERALEIFPNPNTGNFFVKLDGKNEPAKFELYDALGRNIYSQTLINENNDIAFKPGKGIYYACIIHSGIRSAVKKIIVE